MRQQCNLRQASVLIALVAAVFAVAVGSAMALIAGPAWAQTTTITETGSGTASTSPPNCQSTDDRVCTTTVQGSIVGSPINNPDPTEGIVGTFTADYDDADVTGATFTVPATGEVTLTDADGSRLFLSVDGNLSGPLAPAGAPLTFEGTFTITGGTGRFAGATGSGTITAILTGDAFTATLEGILLVPENPDRPSPATQQPAGGGGAPLEITQESEQEAESGDIDQSFEVASTGDNSNQCAGVQGVANTGNPQNEIDLLQYTSDADDFEFEEVGSDITVSPESPTTCVQQVNQAATASG